MNHQISARLIGLLLLSALFAVNNGVRAQDPTPSPSPSAEVAATAPAAAAALTPGGVRVHISLACQN